MGPGYGCPGGASECQTVATAATGDVNGDGRMDAVVGQAEGQSLGGPSLPGGLRWFEAPADRTQPWIRHDLDVEFESTHNIRLADINGDGTMDVVAGEQDQAPLKRLAVFYNDGHGSFTRQVLGTDASHNVAVGDADGDGDLDILAGPHGWWGAPHPLQLFLNRRF